MTLIRQNTDLQTRHISQLDKVTVTQRFFDFVDAAVTVSARATFYNTKEEQKCALQELHQNLFDTERGIYAMSLLLPGLTDYSKQLGCLTLLSNARNGECIITNEQETMILQRLLQQLPTHRMLNLFTMLRQNRVNNARTRKLILRSLLNAPKLELWSVRYRNKMRVALQHAWGKRIASIIRTILTKPDANRSDKEKQILNAQICKYASRKHQMEKILQCVGFVLGNTQNANLPLLRAFNDAKTDFEKGKVLPYEVLEGIRSRYHAERDTAEVLELTKTRLTVGQQMQLQRKAEQSGVDIEIDFNQYSAVKLYLYAYERGLTEEISEVLHRKACTEAENLNMAFDGIGILVVIVTTCSDSPIILD